MKTKNVLITLLSMAMLINFSSAQKSDILTMFLQKRQHKTSNAPFLKPKEAVAKMSIPKGFEVSIYAAEPDIAEPIAFCFDDKGRIWTVENGNYVNRRSHKKGEGTKIQILEDTDSDGVFDTKKLFTDKLPFSSGIATGFGGVYVGTPPNLLFIPDNNGDDKPDGEPQILLDGWGIQDRHETLNSFIWGPDGWLYGCHGVFTQSYVGKPGTPKDQRKFIDGGIWRFHPVKKEFEVFAHGLSNPWGFDFNDVGQGFATCCVIPHLFHIVQGGYFTKQSKPHKNPYVYKPIETIRDHRHLSAHGGARFYLADTFPASYRDQLFMCNIHQHEVLIDFMQRKGSGYIGRHGSDFLPVNDLAWVGFSVEIGPDGGVYILDWHDTDVCGNAINFPDSGRVYRIMPKNAKKIERPNLPKLSDLELAEMQNHSNDWYVRHARVLLHSRATAGKLNRPKVEESLNNLFNSAKTPGKRLRALWAMHVIGSLDEKQMLKLLDHDDEYVRAWTIQLLCESKNPSAEACKKFTSMATNDPSAVVRVYLAAATQRMEFDKRWPVLTELVKHEKDANDHNIPRMLWYSIEPMVPEHSAKALTLAVSGKIPLLQELVPRRMAVKKSANKSGPDPSWQKHIQKIAPGFKVRNVGEGGVRPIKSFRNEIAVQTHPKDKTVPCEIYRELEVPSGKKTVLKVKASYHAHGDWQLRVRAGKKVIYDQIVGNSEVKDQWLEFDLDLSEYAGKKIPLVLENKANDWRNEFGYWGSIKVVSK